VASDIEEVIAGGQFEKAEVLMVVGKENRGNFVSWDVVKVGNVLGSSVGVAEDVLRLGENLGDIVTKISRQGRTASGKAQWDEVVDGDDVAAVGKEGGFWKGGKEEM
jgi:hypothetical protein